MPSGVVVPGCYDYLDVVGQPLEELRGGSVLLAYVGYGEFVELLG